MRKVAFLAALVAVAGASAVQAQGGPPAGRAGEAGARGRGPEGRGGPGAMGIDRVLLQGITLTDAQKGKLKDLREAEREKMQAGRGEQGRGADMEAMRTARQNGDTATLRRLMQEQRTRMDAQRDSQIAAVRAILTSDQLAKFDANVAELKQREAKRGPDGRMGGMGGMGARGGGRGRGRRPPSLR